MKLRLNATRNRDDHTMHQQTLLMDELVAMEVFGRRRIELECEQWIHRQLLWERYDELNRCVHAAAGRLQEPEVWLLADWEIVDCVERLVHSLGALTKDMTVAAGEAAPWPPRSVAERVSRALAGDETARSITRLLRSMLFDGVTPCGRGYGEITQIGIVAAADGGVTFDAGRFGAALERERDAVRALLVHAGSNTANTGAVRRVWSVSERMREQCLFARLADDCEHRVEISTRELANLDARTERRRGHYARMFTSLLDAKRAAKPGLDEVAAECILSAA